MIDWIPAGLRQHGGSLEVWVRIDRGSVGGAKLEVHVGAVTGFSVPTIADPPDELSSDHVYAGGNALGESPSQSVVSVFGVVVEMDVPGRPAVVMLKGHGAA